MGPKAAVSVRASVQSSALPPNAATCSREATALPIHGIAEVAWASPPNTPAHITICDFNQDGRLDLFLAGACQDAERTESGVGGTLPMVFGGGPSIPWRPCRRSPPPPGETMTTMV